MERIITDYRLIITNDEKDKELYPNDLVIVVHEKYIYEEAKKNYSEYPKDILEKMHNTIKDELEKSPEIPDLEKFKRAIEDLLKEK